MKSTDGDGKTKKLFPEIPKVSVKHHRRAHSGETSLDHVHFESGLARFGSQDAVADEAARGEEAGAEVQEETVSPPSLSRKCSVSLTDPKTLNQAVYQLPCIPARIPPQNKAINRTVQARITPRSSLDLTEEWRKALAAAGDDASREVTLMELWESTAKQRIRDASALEQREAEAPGAATPDAGLQTELRVRLKERLKMVIEQAGQEQPPADHSRDSSVAAAAHHSRESTIFPESQGESQKSLASDGSMPRSPPTPTDTPDLHNRMSDGSIPLSPPTPTDTPDLHNRVSSTPTSMQSLATNTSDLESLHVVDASPAEEHSRTGSQGSLATAACSDEEEEVLELGAGAAHEPPAAAHSRESSLTTADMPASDRSGATPTAAAPAAPGTHKHDTPSLEERAGSYDSLEGMDVVEGPVVLDVALDETGMARTIRMAIALPEALEVGDLPDLPEVDEGREFPDLPDTEKTLRRKLSPRYYTENDSLRAEIRKLEAETSHLMQLVRKEGFRIDDNMNVYPKRKGRGTAARTTVGSSRSKRRNSKHKKRRKARRRRSKSRKRARAAPTPIALELRDPPRPDLSPLSTPTSSTRASGEFSHASTPTSSRSASIASSPSQTPRSVDSISSMTDSLELPSHCEERLKELQSLLDNMINRNCTYKERMDWTEVPPHERLIVHHQHPILAKPQYTIEFLGNLDKMRRVFTRHKVMCMCILFCGASYQVAKIPNHLVGEHGLLIQMRCNGSRYMFRIEDWALYKKLVSNLVQESVPELEGTEVGDLVADFICPYTTLARLIYSIADKGTNSNYYHYIPPNVEAIALTVWNEKNDVYHMYPSHDIIELDRDFAHEGDNEIYYWPSCRNDKKRPNDTSVS